MMKSIINNPVVKVGYAILSTMSISNYIKTRAINGSFDVHDTIVKPKYKVSVVMPSYNEELFIGYASQSIKDQNIVQKYPTQFELIVADSNSRDKTAEIAKLYADKVITTPRGKLTARNHVLNELNGEILVSVDADCYYPPNFLNKLLKSFQDKSVVGTSGFTIDHIPYGSITNSLYPIIHFIDNITLNRSRLYGRCSAYYTDLQRLEPFNENIDQTNVGQMVQEEEIGFGRKLSKYGYIIFNPEACCFHFGSIKEGCRENITYSKEIDKAYCEQIRNKERF